MPKTTTKHMLFKTSICSLASSRRSKLTFRASNSFQKGQHLKIMYLCKAKKKIITKFALPGAKFGKRGKHPLMTLSRSYDLKKLQNG